jgi:adenylosuccinate lyase
VHNTAATTMLDELNRVLTDIELAPVKDCRLVVNQLHVANHMHGEAAAHIFTMGNAPASFTRELDRAYNRIDKIEKRFAATCLRTGAG